MGTYLALGLPTKIKASAADLKKIKLTAAQAADAIARDAVAINDNDVWELTETDTLLTWSIRPEVLHAHAADLLQSIGDLYYPESERKQKQKNYDYSEAVKAIRECADGQAIIALSNGEDYTHFQTDNYHSDYIYTGHFSDNFRIKYETTLFFMEGKVSAEGIGNYPNLLRNLCAAALPDNPLAKMLFFYITD
ncbi:MAG: hypothetical protein RI894_2024 [Bacteroidota bacterium]|jgi:hypothetical protein